MSKYKLSIINKYRTELLGIATILVFIYHSKYFEWNRESVSIIQKLGQGGIGADFFLFLSGIGLYRSFSKLGNLREFYKRRFLKIFPTYFSIACIFYVWEWCYYKDSFLSFLGRISTISYWTSRESRFCYWYISYILIFYLLYPFIYKYILPSRKRMACVLSLSFVVQIALIIINGDIYCDLELAFTRIPITVIGCSLGKMIDEKQDYSLTVPLGSLALFVAMWVVRILCNISLQGGWLCLFDKSINMFATLSFCLLYPIIREKLEGWKRVAPLSLFKNVVLWVGEHSLGVYLIHVSLYRILVSYGFTNINIYWLVVLPLTVALAYLDKLLITKIVKK